MSVRQKFSSGAMSPEDILPDEDQRLCMRFMLAFKLVHQPLSWSSVTTRSSLLGWMSLSLLHTSGSPSKGFPGR
eukprot:CAMPEP_0117696370 /NCGR_PEP_ID=MMETSP0804-20121206/28644_1 /TAXON_ID=1074897 /ORGANISM="Tetraselmis astigmatica, Strain CCMP880" /LENGTH=73 /DNA_ID=CAMNT_0005510519 /DNA_START=900 /DNA_END=1121 /DNA_ORIENTATION=-